MEKIFRFNCQYPVQNVNGKEVMTIEGLAKN
jgi:aerobic-type carbon monoxide dehydrogenase small subunit (CoxS/CutS family)